ncbi:hypothetical protein Pmani_000608 [Petrolisthes manimaculis]|uniref:Uncharacterized protein n=1 Tax=Petrolisthes manimaculis TaxID=1843537 RepID=A0AAE1QPS2_9EUCA|nr:hypothetical protein Pmani_000608 [Petrolisthes manimaculis]
MGRNKLTNEEKTRALTLLKEGASVICVAAEVNVKRTAIYNLKKAAAPLPPGTVPPRKPGSGAPRKTSPRTDNIMRREVLNDPAITASELKKKTSSFVRKRLCSHHSTSPANSPKITKPPRRQEAFTDRSYEEETAFVLQEIPALNTRAVEEGDVQ